MKIESLKSLPSRVMIAMNRRKRHSFPGCSNHSHSVDFVFSAMLNGAAVSCCGSVRYSLMNALLFSPSSQLMEVSVTESDPEARQTKGDAQVSDECGGAGVIVLIRRPASLIQLRRIWPYDRKWTC